MLGLICFHICAPQRGCLDIWHQLPRPVFEPGLLVVWGVWWLIVSSEESVDTLELLIYFVCSWNVEQRLHFVTATFTSIFLCLAIKVIVPLPAKVRSRWLPCLISLQRLLLAWEWLLLPTFEFLMRLDFHLILKSVDWCGRSLCLYCHNFLEWVMISVISSAQHMLFEFGSGDGMCVIPDEEDGWDDTSLWYPAS